MLYNADKILYIFNSITLQNFKDCRSKFKYYEFLIATKSLMLIVTDVFYIFKTVTIVFN